jgi:hypothetical protein
VPYNDIPFFLEFVGYQEGADERPRIREEEAGHRDWREGTKDRYGVDDEGRSAGQQRGSSKAPVSGGQRLHKEEAMDHFRRAAAVSTKPFAPPLPA